MIVIPTLGTGGREKIAIDNAVNFDKKKTDILAGFVFKKIQAQNISDKVAKKISELHQRGQYDGVEERETLT